MASLSHAEQAADTQIDKLAVLKRGFREDYSWCQRMMETFQNSFRTPLIMELFPNVPTARELSGLKEIYEGRGETKLTMRPLLNCYWARSSDESVQFLQDARCDTSLVKGHEQCEDEGWLLARNVQSLPCRASCVMRFMPQTRNSKSTEFLPTEEPHPLEQEGSNSRGSPSPMSSPPEQLAMMQTGLMQHTHERSGKTTCWSSRTIFTWIAMLLAAFVLVVAYLAKSGNEHCLNLYQSVCDSSWRPLFRSAVVLDLACNLDVDPALGAAFKNFEDPLRDFHVMALQLNLNTWEKSFASMKGYDEYTKYADLPILYRELRMQLYEVIKAEQWLLEKFTDEDFIKSVRRRNALKIQKQLKRVSEEQTIIGETMVVLKEKEKDIGRKVRDFQHDVSNDKEETESQEERTKSQIQETMETLHQQLEPWSELFTHARQIWICSACSVVVLAVSRCSCPFLKAICAFLLVFTMGLDLFYRTSSHSTEDVQTTNNTIVELRIAVTNHIQRAIGLDHLQRDLAVVHDRIAARQASYKEWIDVLFKLATSASSASQADFRAIAAELEKVREGVNEVIDTVIKPVLTEFQQQHFQNFKRIVAERACENDHHSCMRDVLHLPR